MSLFITILVTFFAGMGAGDVLHCWNYCKVRLYGNSGNTYMLLFINIFVVDSYVF